MDVEITFTSGRSLRTYDLRYEAPELAVGAHELKVGGWIRIGHIVCHTRQIESMRWLDPESEEASA